MPQVLALSKKYERGKEHEQDTHTHYKVMKVECEKK